MGILVLVLLVAAWGLVLGPALLRTTQEPSPLKTEKMFNRALRALSGQRGSRDHVLGGRRILVPRQSDYPTAPGVPAARSPNGKPSAAERRRRNLAGLSALIIVTFLLGLVPALRFLLVVCLIACLLLIAYLIAAMVYAARPVQPQPRRAAMEHRPAPPEVAGGSL